MIKKIIKKQYLLFFLLSVILILPSILPLFRSDFFRMHDWLHVSRLIELDVALRDGQIPPRWAPDFGWGMGMPLLHFYAPLPYYFAEIFYFLGVSAVWSIKLVFMLNFFAGFYFMYLWTKQFWGKIGGILAAVSFVYLPYRAVQFYVRGSLGELTAMTFLPLFFYSAHKLINKKQIKFVFLTALSLAGIFISHSPIALFSIFFLSLYFIWKLFFQIKLIKKKFIFPFKTFKSIITSAILAFGLSAFFILPAFFEKQYTVLASSIGGGFFHYSFHFIYLRQLFNRRWAYGGSILGIEDDISFQIGFPQVILALFAGIVLFLAFKKKKKVIISELTYLATAFSLAVFLMTFHSKFIWDKLSIIQITQFPWRLLTFVSTFTAFASGAIVWLIKNKNLKKTIVGLLIILTIGLNYKFFNPKEYSSNQIFYFTDREKIRTKTSDTLIDYLPIGSEKPKKPLDKDFATTSSINDFYKKTGYFSFTSNSSEKTDFILNQYYFPGWQATIDQQKVNIKPDKQLGRIQFQLPSGEHQVKIKLGKTKLQYWSDIISLISWTSLIGFLLFRKVNKL